MTTLPPNLQLSNATLRPDAESADIYQRLRIAFLILMLAGYVFYPFDLYILGHWLESWKSRIPFFVAVPSAVFTFLMLFWPRVPWIRQIFIILMVLNMITGIAGVLFHFMYNFEGAIEWTFKGIKDAMQGTRPVLAAAAFTHIGFTGLLCSFLTAPISVPVTTTPGIPTASEVRL